MTTPSSGVIFYTLLGSLSDLSDNMIIRSLSYLGARIWMVNIKGTYLMALQLTVRGRE